MADKHRRNRNIVKSNNTDLLGANKLRTAVAIFCLALFTRGLYLYDSSDNPTFNWPIVDSLTYDHLARQLTEEGKSMPPEFFWQQFFYPFWLVIVYSLSNSSVLPVKLLQILLGSITSVLIYKLGEKIFNRPAGILAGCIFALYGPAVFFEGELLAACWATFWAVTLITLFIKVVEHINIKLCFSLGICSALSIITRPNFIPFLLAAGLWTLIIWIKNRTKVRLLLLTAASVIAGFAVVVIPVMAQHYKVEKRLSFLPGTGGINLYIGNNPDFEATSIRPGIKWKNITELPVKQGFKTDAEKRKFFYSKTAEYIKTQPVSFLKGLLHKTSQFLCSRETPGNIDVYLFSKWSKLHNLLTFKIAKFGFPFGLILPLTVLGLFFYWRAIPIPIIFFLVLYPATIILTHIEARYRMPIIPPMCILASAALLKIAHLVRNKQLLNASVYVAAIIVIAFLCSLPGPFYSEQKKNINYEAELYFSLGDSFGKRSRDNDAIAAYTKAVEIRPDYIEAHHNLAQILLEQGKAEKAIQHYQAALKNSPNSADLYEKIGAAFSKLGKLQQAIEYYQKALEITPQNAGLYNNIATAFLHSKRFPEAIDYYKKAFELKPSNSMFCGNIGTALAMSGNTEQAIEYYQKALAINPSNTAILTNLANSLAMLGRLEEAAENYVKSLQVNPNDADIHFYYGLCLQKQKKTSQAITEYNKALKINPRHTEAKHYLNNIKKK